MYEGNFVICDIERQYAGNLLRQFTKRENPGLRFYLFHSLEEVKEFSQTKTIKIFLVGEEFSEEERKSISAGKCFVLVKDEESQKILSYREVGIYRYQSAEQIWKKVWEKPEGRKKKSRKKVPENKTVSRKTAPEEEGAEQLPSGLIGVYSPVHRIGKTNFAITLGKKLAEKEPVLYLNLSEYAGGNPYFPDAPKQTLADLLYFMKQEKGKIGIRISMMVGQNEKLDYILPIPYLQDLKSVTATQWLDVLDEIQKQCIYEKVILDLGDCVDGLFEILEQCQTIFMPYIEDESAHAKITRYVENLRKSGKEQILERTIQKKMK